MLIARTPMSVSQLASPNPPTLPHSALDGRNDPRPSIQPLIAAAGSRTGRDRSRDTLRIPHVADRVTARRRRVRPTPTQRTTPANTARRPPRTVAPVTTTFPEIAPPA